MNSLVPTPRSLDAIRSAIWTELLAARDNTDHPWGYAHLATVGQDGPEQRVLILRDVDVEHRSLLVQTDIRSPKIEQLRREPRVSWLFIDPEHRIQLTLRGIATVHAGDPLADRQWEQSRLESRRNYLALHPPGDLAAEPSTNLPAAFEDRLPTAEEAAPGRFNFAVIRSEINSLDILFVNRSGNLRARFSEADGFAGTWVHP